MTGDRSVRSDSAAAIQHWFDSPTVGERAAFVRFRIGVERHTLRIPEPGRTVASHGLQATWRWQSEGQGYRMWVRLANRGKTAVHLDTVDVLTAPMPDLGIPPPHWSVYQNGWNTWTPTFVSRLGRSFYADPGTPAYRMMHRPHWEEEPAGARAVTSEWVTVIAGHDQQASQRRAVLLGFVTMKDQLGQIRLQADGQAVTARCYFDGIVLSPGDSLGSEVLVLRAGPDPLALLEEWAELAGQEMKARVPARPPTGWCTWYYFYGQNTAADVLQNVEAIARLNLPLDVILIDDGYQVAIGDWLSLRPDRFPDGIEPLVQAIRQAGHRPGIWTAPFGVAEDSRLFAEHPGWVLRDDAGEPVFGWTHSDVDCYALDITHPEVLAWLRETFGHMRHQWGFDLFKIDFLAAAACPGRRHDPTATRAQALRRGVEAIREAIGDDAFLLGCGVPLGPCVGLVDGMRVGPDVDPNWRPIWRHDLSMPSAANALRNSLARASFHGRLWANDPDCLLVRQRGRDLDLVLNEVRSLSALVALLGGLTLDSDHLPAVRPGRLKYLRQALPPTGVSARPVDLFENEMPRLLLLPVERAWGRWWVAGVVNWTAQTTETTVRLADLGLPPGRYHVYHYWRRRYLGLTEDAVTVHRHQPHETVVLLFKPVSDRPDLLTTTFHVCQGTAEVADCEWRSGEWRLENGDWKMEIGDGEEGGVLAVRLEKAGRQFGELLFAVPQGWRAAEARVDGVKRYVRPVAPGVVVLGLTLEGSAQVDVRFAKS